MLHLSLSRGAFSFRTLAAASLRARHRNWTAKRLMFLSARERERVDHIHYFVSAAPLSQLVLLLSIRAPPIMIVSNILDGPRSRIFFQKRLPLVRRPRAESSVDYHLTHTARGIYIFFHLYLSRAEASIAGDPVSVRGPLIIARFSGPAYLSL